MTRENFPPHWNRKLVNKLEANPLWQEYAATHPTKQGGRDLADIRSFAESIMDERMPPRMSESA